MFSSVSHQIQFPYMHIIIMHGIMAMVINMHAIPHFVWNEAIVFDGFSNRNILNVCTCGSERTLNVFALWNIEKSNEPNCEISVKPFEWQSTKVNTLPTATSIKELEEKNFPRQILGHLVDWFDFHFNLFAIAIFTIHFTWVNIHIMTVCGNFHKTVLCSRFKWNSFQLDLVLDCSLAAFQLGK